MSKFKKIVEITIVGLAFIFFAAAPLALTLTLSILYSGWFMFLILSYIPLARFYLCLLDSVATYTRVILY